MARIDSIATQDPELIGEEKRALRSQVIARRNALSPVERAAMSLSASTRFVIEAKEHLKSIGAFGPGAQPLFAGFASMGSEVTTDPLIEGLLEVGWRVALPCMMRVPAGHGQGQSRSSRMVFRLIDERTLRDRYANFIGHPLRAYDEGSPELEGCPEVDPELIDCMAVPLVAFDDAGGRLGYGGGNYDAYLPRLRPDAFVAGLAFQAQRVERVPREPHDLLLPRVITE